VDTRNKLGLGCVLAVVGAFGIVVSPLLGWSQIKSPWAFLLGFLFGVSAGLGVALAIHALLQRRIGK
jgi:predicted ABC-type sugar transport system permease subunit